MKAVFLKELRQFFCTASGYIYWGIFVLICGYCFLTTNLLPASGDIRDFFSSMILVITLMIPLLTMRSFSEEKKMRTIQLLRLAPVSPSSIVMGKYAALILVFSIGLLPTLAFVVLLAQLGHFHLPIVTGNYLGLLCAASSFLSIGLFLSTLTENQLIACVVTYCVLIGLWLSNTVAAYVSLPWLQSFLRSVSLQAHFTTFAMGIFSFSSLVYYLSITAFFLYLSVFSLQKQYCM